MTHPISSNPPPEKSPVTGEEVSPSSASRPGHTVLEDAVRTLPRLLGWPVARGYQVDGSDLKPLSRWYLSEPERFARFCSAGEAPSDFELSLGGRAVSSRAPVLLDDIGADPRFADPAQRDGIAAGVAVPVLGTGGPLAVIELFTDHLNGFGSDTLATLGHAGVLLGRAVEGSRDPEPQSFHENLLHQIIAQCHEAVFVKDRQGRYTHINEAGARIVGLTPEEVIGHTDRDLFLEPDALEITSADHAVMEAGESRTMQGSVRAADGSIMHYIATKGPVRDSDGEVWGSYGVARDITELETTRAQLKERVKEISALNRITHEISSSDGHTWECLDRIVEHIPPGWHYPDITEARIVLDDWTATTAAFEETPWMQSENIAANGDVIGRVDVALTEPVADPDQPAFLEEEAELLRGIARAIGDAVTREHLEHAFMHAQKMEALGRLAGGVAHDFNNLLTAVAGHAELLARDLGDSHPGAEDLAAICDAAERGRGLTGQLLAFSRRENGRSGTVDLGAMVQKLKPLLTSLISERVRIDMDLSDHELPVPLDMTHGTQILMNLCVNACDAMPDGGRLTITTRARTAGDPVPSEGGPLPPGRYALLEVADTGEGIDPAARNQLFDPFFTTKAEGKGTGLGLSIIWGSVRKAGGGIDVESAPGEGTRFRIFLPLVEAETSDAPEAPEATPVECDGTVLVVDDEPSLRRVLERALQREGFRVLTAEDGEAALDIVSSESSVDLIISDMVMPGMGGAALIRHLEELGKEIPVLLTSGYTPDDLPRFRTDSTGVGFLKKPFSIGELVEQVGILLPAPPPTDIA